MNKKVLTYRTNKDEGLLSLFVDGEYLTDCCYEDEPHDAFTWCEKLFNAGVNSSKNSEEGK